MGKKIFVKSQQELKRHKVKALLKNKGPRKAISKTVGVTERSVKNISKRKTARRKQGSGRKNILDKRNKMRILSLIKTNPFISCSDIVERLTLPCTARTARNYLSNVGFKWKLADSTLLLTPEN